MARLGAICTSAPDPWVEVNTLPGSSSVQVPEGTSLLMPMLCVPLEARSWVKAAALVTSI